MLELDFDGRDVRVDLRRFEPLVEEGRGNTHSMPFVRHRSHELPSFRSDFLVSPRHLSCGRRWSVLIVLVFCFKGARMTIVCFSKVTCYVKSKTKHYHELVPQKRTFFARQWLHAECRCPWPWPGGSFACSMQTVALLESFVYRKVENMSQTSQQSR